MDKKPKIKDFIFFAVVISIIAGIIVTRTDIKNTDRKYTSESDVKMLVGVHIKGAVKNPGYYELPYEKRVADAIKIAGGATKNADVDAINLAEVLRDGQEIAVPSLEEVAAVQGGDKVNINTADVYRLCSVTGIDKELAIDITEYRNKNGKFKSVDELKKLKKVSDKLFNRIKDKLCTE